jgi:hypothetical protein
MDMIISKAYFSLKIKESRLKAQIQVQTVFLSLPFCIYKPEPFSN